MMTVRSMKVFATTEKKLCITKANVLKYIGANGCTSLRLFQVFLGHIKNQESKRYDRYTRRLVMTINSLKRKNIIAEAIKTVADQNGDSQKISVLVMRSKSNG